MNPHYTAKSSFFGHLMMLAGPGAGGEPVWRCQDNLDVTLAQETCQLCRIWGCKDGVFK